MPILSGCSAISSKNEYIKIFIIIGILAVGYFFLLTDKPEVHSDAKDYILIAKSILRGEGYPDDPAARFPFIFPLMLIPVIYFFGYNFFIMKLIVTIFALSAVYFIYVLMRDVLDEKIALLIMFLVGISSTLLEFTIETADVPFLFFSIVAMTFINRYRNDERLLSKHLFLAGFFILSAFFTRIAGITLCIASVLYLIFEGFNEKAERGKFFSKSASLFVIMVIPIAIWTYLHWNFLIKEYVVGYLSKNKTCPELGFYTWVEYFKGWIASLPNDITNLWRLIFIGERTLSRIHQSVAMAFKISTVLIFILGLILQSSKKRTIVEYYTICNLIVLIFYKTWIRHYLIILPFVIYYFIVGVRFIINKLFPFRIQQILFTFVIIMIVVSNLTVDVQLYKLKHSLEYLDSWPDYLTAIKWISANTPEDSIIMAFHPAWVSVFSDRKAVGYPWVSESKYICDSIQKNRVNYILVDSFVVLQETKKYLIPAIESRLDAFDLVYTVNQTKVYKVR